MKVPQGLKPAFLLIGSGTTGSRALLKPSIERNHHPGLKRAPVIAWGPSEKWPLSAPVPTTLRTNVVTYHRISQGAPGSRRPPTSGTRRALSKPRTIAIEAV